MNDRTHILNINVPKGTNIRTTVTPVKVFKNMDYLRIFCETLQELAKDKSLVRSDYAVLLYCLSLSNYENEFTVSQGQIAQECNISRTEVNKSISKLRMMGYMIVSKTIGRQNVYFINPQLSFKTRALNYGTICQQFDELILSKETT